MTVTMRAMACWMTLIRLSRISFPKIYRGRKYHPCVSPSSPSDIRIIRTKSGVPIPRRYDSSIFTQTLLQTLRVDERSCVRENPCLLQPSLTKPDHTNTRINDNKPASTKGHSAKNRARFLPIHQTATLYCMSLQHPNS